ncbi:glutathione transferase GstA [Rugamonas sp. CCM 8940]|uniref:glutathione transferase GstA n=1 Tax=Rugamonas sp. CCM 8940 TaxID=2765359 RepID=UPI0018F5D157|nr:glutathione transferase GstA [Rugamonas sp. CCM 8940]MBJ7311374.1 glutathione transferase GstA [Rugamonas sp. CCM 8940]
MKLYFSPGACSLSPHIVLLEAGLAFDAERVDLRSKRTASGADFYAIQPQGYVPALQLDGGLVLTEGPAIVQYLADLAPHKQLAPPAGSLGRYQLAAWLNFIGTELHKNFSPLFDPGAADALKDYARANLARRLAHVGEVLAGNEYLMGKQFSVADAYLFTVLNWAGMVKVDLSPWPALAAFQARVAARPAVQQAMREEGLIPAD